MSTIRYHYVMTVHAERVDDSPLVKSLSGLYDAPSGLTRSDAFDEIFSKAVRIAESQSTTAFPRDTRRPVLVPGAGAAGRHRDRAAARPGGTG